MAQIGQKLCLFYDFLRAGHPKCNPYDSFKYQPNNYYLSALGKSTTSRSHPLDNRNDITQITPVPAARLKNTNTETPPVLQPGNKSHDESGYNSDSIFSTFEKKNIEQ